MTNDPVTGNSAIAIDDWLLEGRRRVSPWLITSEWLNNQFFADNPQCEAFIRPVFPNELPLSKSDEVWLVVVRRGQPDVKFIQIENTSLLPDQILRDKGTMNILCTEFREDLRFTTADPPSVYILDSQMRVITC